MHEPESRFADGDSAFFRNYKSKQTCLGRLRRIAGRRSASGLPVFLPAVCAFTAMPTIVVTQFAVIISANRADFTGNRRSSGGSIAAVAGVAAAGCSGQRRSHFAVLINHRIDRELVRVEIQLVVSGVIACVQNIYHGLTGNTIIVETDDFVVTLDCGIAID